MKVSQNCINLIKKYEGCRLQAYKDIGGVLTIGYGHTNNVKINDVITQDEADNLLLEDIKKYEKKVDKYSKYNFSQNEYDALVSFAYNIGSIDGLTKCGRRSKEVIGKKILEYCKCNGKKVQGLYNRRLDEYKLYTSNNESKNTNEEIAKEVINGKWGNGVDRKQKLKNAGYNYSEIQKIVNKLLKK